MKMTVWEEDWQMQCCGDPFSLGTSVTWTLDKADRDWLASVLGDDRAA
jgi:hypothetical protein